MAKAKFGGFRNQCGGDSIPDGSGGDGGELNGIVDDMTDDILDADLILRSFGISDEYSSKQAATDDVTQFLNDISRPKLESGVQTGGSSSTIHSNLLNPNSNTQGSSGLRPMVSLTETYSQAAASDIHSDTAMASNDNFIFKTLGKTTAFMDSPTYTLTSAGTIMTSAVRPSTGYTSRMFGSAVLSSNTMTSVSTQQATQPATQLPSNTQGSAGHGTFLFPADVKPVQTTSRGRDEMIAASEVKVERVCGYDRGEGLGMDLDTESFPRLMDIDSLSALHTLINTDMHILEMSKAGGGDSSYQTSLDHLSLNPSISREFFVRSPVGQFSGHVQQEMQHLLTDAEEAGPVIGGAPLPQLEQRPFCGGAGQETGRISIGGSLVQQESRHAICGAAHDQKASLHSIGGDLLSLQDSLNAIGGSGAGFVPYIQYKRETSLDDNREELRVCGTPLFTVPTPLPPAVMVPLSPSIQDQKPANGVWPDDVRLGGRPETSPRSTPRPSPESTPPPMQCDAPVRGDTRSWKMSGRSTPTGKRSRTQTPTSEGEMSDGGLPVFLNRSWKRSGRSTPTGKRSRAQTPTSEGEMSDGGFREREPHGWGTGRITPVDVKTYTRLEDMIDEDKYNKRRRSTSGGERGKKDPIKLMLEQLQSKIPHIGNPDEEKVSHAGLLVEGSDYIRSLMRENKSTKENVEALKIKIEELNAEIEAAQEKLPEHGSSSIHRIISTHGKSIPDMFADHVRLRTREDWRYWVFTSIMGHFVHSFAQEVSNISPREMERTSLEWIKERISLQQLRKDAFRKLAKLCSKTSVMENPSILPEEARSFVEIPDESSQEEEEQDPPAFRIKY